MIIVFYFILLFFVGVVAGLFLDSILSFSNNLLRSLDSLYSDLIRPDSEKGVKNKERLASVYLTIAGILLALGKLPSNLGSTIFVFLFFVTFITYFILLQINKDRRSTFIFGFVSALFFSYILTESLMGSMSGSLNLLYFISNLLYFRSKLIYLFFLTLIVGISLTLPIGSEVKDDYEVEDKYELY